MDEDIKGAISRVQRGDDASFKIIYDAYIKRIYNFVYRLVDVSDDAEDITQETFIIVYNQIRELKDPDRFESWIYRIARNEVYQRYRRRKGTELSLDDEDSGLKDSLPMDTLEADPLESVLQVELGRVIEKVLVSLPFKLREVFVLAVLDQHSYEEISRIVGRSLLSVKTDIHRARVLARSALRKYLTKSQ